MSAKGPRHPFFDGPPQSCEPNPRASKPAVPRSVLAWVAIGAALWIAGLIMLDGIML